MFSVTDSARDELNKVLASAQAKDKHLIFFFQGHGWGGPTLGMALDEAIGELEKIESNGISAYIDPKLKEMLKSYGEINVDYVNSMGRAGYSIRVGEPKDCGGCSC